MTGEILSRPDAVDFLEAIAYVSSDMLKSFVRTLGGGDMVIVTRSYFRNRRNITWGDFGTKVIKPIIVVGARRRSYAIFKFPSNRPKVLYGVGRIEI